MIDRQVYLVQRYFVEQFAQIDNEFTIKGDDFYHITRVMRMKEGDTIICAVSETNKSAVCSISHIHDDHLVAIVQEWLEQTVELPVHVTIASGLPKGDKLEWIIQKGTELGAYSFIPFTAARSIVKWDAKKATKKIERWEKIAKEAAEQSHRNLVPEIQFPVTIKGLIDIGQSYKYKVIAYEEEAKHGEAAMLTKTFQQLQPGDSLLFVFGPEGGLTEAEVSLLGENGFISCGLGPRILRTETAPLYALSAVSYYFELMR